MTTGENIDSINESENLTVTSDAAFERVTNDFKIEEERDVGSLKQNTAGLVDEIPNISFLDISDTLLESDKTLYGKENWIVRVGMNSKSIETQPQDIGIFRDVDTTVINTGLGIASFNTYIPGSNNTCFVGRTEPGTGALYVINIGGIYRASYSFCASDIDANAKNISWYMMRRHLGVLYPINQQSYTFSSSVSKYSASGDTHIELEKGDVLLFAVKITDSYGNDVTWKYEQGEFTLQFIQYRL